MSLGHFLFCDRIVYMKAFIKNRKGQKIAVLIDENSKSNGLAFVMHGLGGFKEQKHIELMAKVLFDNGYTVMRFDTTGTAGESEGNPDDWTTTKYLEDLEGVIFWSLSQSWHKEPFGLMAHSH